ncbi:MULTISPECIES: hypothetical protein [unclassified Streptomyces]|uniref:hypothetical protein n=1 Tax=unclassified Streptomyces TaxID=2593676 RepID=UPI00403CF220
MYAHSQLAQQHIADLRAQADAHRLAAQARPPRRELRTRLGWTLVEIGLRLASAPAGTKPALV